MTNSTDRILPGQVDSEVPVVDEILWRPLRAFWDQIVDRAPSIATALLILFVLWIVARLVRASIARVVGMTKLDQALQKTRVAAILEAFSSGLTASKALAYVAYMAVLLMAWTSATEVVGLHAVRDTLRAVLAYLPRLMSALLVVVLGGYLAGVVRRSVGAVMSEVRSPFARALESIAEGFLLVVVATVAIDVLGINIGFITSNLTVVVGAILATFAFLFMWSMRRPAEDIIANYYLRRLINVGDQIELAEVTGVVSQFAPLGVVVITESDEERFIPARNILTGLARTEKASPSTLRRLQR